MKNRNLKHSDNWATPKDFYDKLNAEFVFDSDPCPLNYDEITPDKIGSVIMKGFAFDNIGKNSKRTANKRKDFNAEWYAKRLEKVEIFQRDAIEIIKLKDSKDTFFYLDPPYINTDQGFYSYMENDYRNLLETISCIKGKFLLNSYMSEILDEYIKRNNWNVIKLEKKLIALPSKRTDGKRKTKVECLIYNYEIPQKRLF